MEQQNEQLAMDNLWDNAAEMYAQILKKRPQLAQRINLVRTNSSPATVQIVPHYRETSYFTIDEMSAIIKCLKVEMLYRDVYCCISSWQEMPSIQIMEIK